MPLATQASLNLPETLSGRFEVHRHLGDGWLTRAWLVSDRFSGQPGVLKMLRPDVASVSARKGRTAHVLAAWRATLALQHPSFVESRDLGSLPFGAVMSAYLLTEHVPGRDLAALVAEGPLPLPVAARILLQVVDALEGAAPYGPHLGLCPANVLVEVDPVLTVRITDHGTLVGLARDVPLLALEHAGRRAWLAPEQLAGRHSGAQTDLWQLGALLRFCLTGKTPATPIPHDQLSPAVDRLVRWLMDPDPNRRPDDFDSLRLQLEVMSHEVDTRSPTPTLQLDRPEPLPVEDPGGIPLWMPAAAFAAAAVAAAVWTLS